MKLAAVKFPVVLLAIGASLCVTMLWLTASCSKSKSAERVSQLALHEAQIASHVDVPKSVTLSSVKQRTRTSEPTIQNPTVVTDGAPASKKPPADIFFARALKELESDASPEVGESHEAPLSVATSGHVIGRLLELGERNEGARNGALETFVRCAESPTAPLSVRAHCFATAVRVSGSWKIFVALSEAHVATDVQTLAGKLLAATGD